MDIKSVACKLKIEDEIKGSIIICFDKMMYFSGLCGDIKQEDVLQNKKQKIILVCSKIKQERGGYIKLKIFSSRNSFSSIEIKSKDRGLVISEDFFPEQEVPIIPLGDFTHVHDALICDLMNSIGRSSKPLYEMLAIANLVAVDHRIQRENVKFDMIVDLVRTNYMDESFSLDKLAEIAYMSRRKLQYILAEENVSFVELVSCYRLNYFKSLLKNNPHQTLTRLVADAGFKSTASANRVTQKYLNLTLKELRKSLGQ